MLLSLKYFRTEIWSKDFRRRFQFCRIPGTGNWKNASCWATQFDFLSIEKSCQQQKEQNKNKDKISLLNFSVKKLFKMNVCFKVIILLVMCFFKAETTVAEY